MPSYPSVGRMLAAVLSLLLLTQLALASLLAGHRTRLGLLAVQLALLLLLCALIAGQRLSFRTVLLLNPFPRGSLLLVLLAGAGTAVAVSFFEHSLFQLLSWMGWQRPVALPQAELRLHLIQHPRQIPIVLAVGTLLPSLGEELLFHGYVFTSLYAHQRPAAAVGGSAVLFAAAHMDLWEFLPMLLYGLMLGMLTLSTRSVHPAILAHALNNLLACAQINLHTYLDWSLRDLPCAGSPVVGLAAAALATGALVLLRRRLPPVPSSLRNPRTGPPWSSPSTPPPLDR